MASATSTEIKKEENRIKELSSQLKISLLLGIVKNEQEMLLGILQDEQAINELSPQFASTFQIKTAQDGQEINELISQLRSALPQERDKEVIRNVESVFKRRFTMLTREFNQLIVAKNALVTKRDCGNKLLSRLSESYKLDNLETLDEEVLQTRISKLRSASEELKVKIDQMDQDFLEKKKSGDGLMELQEDYKNTLQTEGSVNNALVYMDEAKNTLFQCNILLREVRTLNGLIASNKAALEEKLQKCKSSNVGNSSNLSKINSIESIFELEIEVAGSKRAVIDKENKISIIDNDNAKLSKVNSTLEENLMYKAVFDYAEEKFRENPENCVWERN